MFSETILLYVPMHPSTTIIFEKCRCNRHAFSSHETPGLHDYREMIFHKAAMNKVERKRDCLRPESQFIAS